MKHHLEAVWGGLQPETQRQIRKAGMAAAIAFVTVFAAPLINPLHPSHRASGGHASRETERRGGPQPRRAARQGRPRTGLDAPLEGLVQGLPRRSP